MVSIFMFQHIAKMTPVLEKYSNQLLSEGIISQAELDAMKQRIWGVLEADFSSSKNYKPTSAEWVSSTWGGLLFFAYNSF
jgi:2-oxoglutarate dehydrogenase E1 component